MPCVPSFVKAGTGLSPQPGVSASLLPGDAGDLLSSSRVSADPRFIGPTPRKCCAGNEQGSTLHSVRWCSDALLTRVFSRSSCRGSLSDSPGRRSHAEKFLERDRLRFARLDHGEGNRGNLSNFYPRSISCRAGEIRGPGASSSRNLEGKIFDFS